ncbi:MULTISPECIES: GDSL-type esterase/lipase family protein [unclassified Mucilaginibacter]|uniref:GDSL-type esterase/lipase family protein n=1 Tax=unclassified Mucilaginibacter TaxID=2617802 RepID=UPI000B28763A|nr:MULTISPECIES: GDSL-type esterase/lipase family protein [unclassified Mucilaginibacter]PLW88483.1 MAG: lipolytic protein G-D-S-L family [Mucilaginibacter sp.]PMP66188.1 MAG: lipolytic protein G-D-S-L family [Mucilaginibacter sp.]HEK18956.1 lipolytic protein G-D-S-L family [Bacteroidota bacterium]
MKKHFKRVAIAIFSLGLLAFTIAKPPKVNIVFIGDSITYGQNMPDLQPSVYVLTFFKEKFKAIQFTQANHGVSGYTTKNFLPGEPDFEKVVKDADAFYSDRSAQLIFSVMLGTNDSAINGPYGSPISQQQYRVNLKTIADSLLKRYPNSKIVFNYPIYYTPNTYNGAMYLQEGLDRLQSYFPQIDALVQDYSTTNPGQVYSGYKNGFADFKKDYLHLFMPEQGHQGIFYLHPNKDGARLLGQNWGKVLAKVINH